MAKMSKAQYFLLAKALREANDYCDDYPDRVEEGVKGGIDMAAKYITQALAKDNPAFNPVHFLKMVRREVPLIAPTKRK
jgi:hypothetical protein